MAETTEGGREAIRVYVPRRYLVLGATGGATGLSLGLMRGAREAGWRFLAENAHRAPTTVAGWYLYKKTKNYRMMWGGLRAGGRDAVRLGAAGAAWAALEDGMERAGAGAAREAGAGLGTAGLVCALYRLPFYSARRVVVLGVVSGSVMSLLRYGQAGLARVSGSGEEKKE